MSKIQSGLILVVVGVAMNLLGRLIIPATRGGESVLVAGIMAAWMVASVVVVLFGLFRLIMGLVTQKRSAKAE